MTNPHLYLIVIAGGSGTRFWPKSTSKLPKQLLNFNDQNSKNQSLNRSSLLTQTLSRFNGMVSPNQQVIVTTQDLSPVVQAQVPSVTLLAEPQGRNTAPCIYWAARHVFERDSQGMMLVMPADHHIACPEKFIRVVQAAVNWASKNDDLVTLGIKPTRPETGYGYLKTEEKFSDLGNVNFPKQVLSFVEKPNLDTAKEFLKSEHYLWNGGMFVWRAEIILKAFDQFMPEMKVAWEKTEGHVENAYPLLTATSVDFGIMEKAKNVVTFPLDCGWDDLGSWTSLENLAEFLGIQRGENVFSGKDLVALESSQNIIDTPNKFVALLGVKNLIIVEQGETLMVVHKDRAQDIKRIVEEVKKQRPDLV